MTQLDLFGEVENKAGSINGKRIFIFGTIPDFNKSEIKKQLEKRNVIFDNTLTKYCNLFILGNNPDEEVLQKYSLLEYDGYKIPKGTISDLYSILEGSYTCELKDVVKKVNITYDFIKQSQVVYISKDKPQHPLGQREILVPKKSNWQLKQTLGNIGAYTTTHFDPKTTDYIWLTKDIENKLKQGIQDDFIKYVSEVYNKSSADKFVYSFLKETNVLRFIERRCLDSGDKLTLGLLRESQKNL